MTYEFVDATRERIHFKGALYGPGGSGKTYTMLRLLHSLCPTGKIAVICTERGRVKKYVGVNGWAFKVLTPSSFDPASLTEILAVCAQQGFEGVGIDSWTHYWNGAGGMLEQVDRKAAAGGRNDKFGGGWKEMRPVERAMLDSVLAADFHIVATLRVKTEYVIEEKVRADGRVVATPRKVGMKPEQREGFEYEFDMVGELDVENVLTVTKSDLITVPQGLVVPQPGPEFAALIADFCSEGFVPVGVDEYRAQALSATATREELLALLDTVTRVNVANAAVMDADGNPTVLAALIKSRGRAVAEAARAHLAAVPPGRVVATSDVEPPASPRSSTAATIDGQASPAAQDVFAALVFAETKETAQAAVASIQGTDVGREDIYSLLVAEDLEALGVSPVTERLTLVSLGARVVAYTTKHGRSIRGAGEGHPTSAVA